MKPYNKWQYYKQVVAVILVCLPFVAVKAVLLLNGSKLAISRVLGMAVVGPFAAWHVAGTEAMCVIHTFHSLYYISQTCFPAHSRIGQIGRHLLNKMHIHDPTGTVLSWRTSASTQREFCWAPA